ncbi:MAG: LysE family transporter [Rhodobacteraceae bacterium]|nr:LysE family transporter [Paracoccaceae bacterium]
MSIEDLVAFNFALVVAIVSPGPALLVAIQTTLSSGRTAGMATGYGLGLMAATWTMLALFGLEAIFRVVPWAYTTTKAIGMIYLFYIAWGMWAGAREKVVPTRMTARNSFVRGVLVNALNPKSVLFAGAVLVVIFPENMTISENATIVLNHLVVEFIFYSILAICMGSQIAGDAYLGAKVFIDRTASLILGALGLRLLVGE